MFSFLSCTTDFLHLIVYSYLTRFCPFHHVLKWIFFFSSCTRTDFLHFIMYSEIPSTCLFYIIPSTWHFWTILSFRVHVNSGEFRCFEYMYTARHAEAIAPNSNFSDLLIFERCRYTFLISFIHEEKRFLSAASPFFVLSCIYRFDRSLFPFFVHVSSIRREQQACIAGTPRQLVTASRERE